jgi:6-phosphogluconolactonase
VDATSGRLRHNGYVGAGSGPTVVTVEPSGHFTYVANADSHEVSVYTIDSTTGALTTVGTIRAQAKLISVAVGVGSKPVTFTPKFVHVTRQSTSDVSGDEIDAGTNTIKRFARSLLPVGKSDPPLQEALANQLSHRAMMTEIEISGCLISTKTTYGAIGEGHRHAGDRLDLSS